MPPDAPSDASEPLDAQTRDGGDAVDDGGGPPSEEQPYLVFVRGGEVRSVRADRLDEIATLREGSEPGFVEYVSLEYARGGDALIAVVRTQADYTVYAWYRSAPDGESPHVLGQLESTTAPGLSAQVTPDGQHVFVLTPGEAPDVYRLEAESPVALEHELEAWTEASPPLVASSDARHVLYGTRDALQLVDLEDPEATVTVHVNDDSAFVGWWNARFSPDGSTIAFDVYASSGKRVHVIGLADALAGQPLRTLALDDNTSAYLEHVSERGIFARYDIGGEPFNPDSRVLAVHDFQGDVLATIEVSTEDNFPAYCGNVALVTATDDSALFIHDTASGVEQSANAPAIPVEARPLLSSSCDAVVYDDGQDVYYFEVPEPSALSGDVVVHRLEDRKNGRLAGTSVGNYVTGITGSTMHIWREGQPDLSLEGELFEGAFSADGTRYVYIERDELSTLPYELFVRSLALTGASRGEVTTLLGPITQQNPLVLDATGRYLALDAVPSIADDGGPSGINGLVELDLSVPEPVPSHVDVGSARTPGTGARVLRIPGQRSVLIEIAEGFGCGARLFVHTLEPGAEAVEQEVGGPPLSCEEGLLQISSDGEQVAVHRSLRETSYFATVTLSASPDDEPALETYDAEPYQAIAAFGAQRDRLIVYSDGRFDVPATLTRIDLALGISIPIFSTSGGTLRVMHVAPETERIVFAVTSRNGAETTRVFISDLDDDAPTELPTVVADDGRRSHVASSGEWLTLHTEDGQLVVHDERDNWSAHVLTAVGSGDDTALYEHDDGEGLVLLRDNAVHAYLWDREAAFDEPREVQWPASERTSISLTQDGRRALFFATLDAGNETGLFALDLASATPALERLADRPSFDASAGITIWPVGSDRFALVTQGLGEQTWLVGLEDQPTRALPLAANIMVDRLGRYLAYNIFDPASSTLYVLSLAEPNAEPTTVATTSGGFRSMTWVD